MHLLLSIFSAFVALFLFAGCQTTEEKFVQANESELSLQMAQGEGEKLNQLAVMHGCKSPESQAAFKQMAQSSYGQIYSRSESTGQEILQNLRAELMGWNDAQALCGAPATADSAVSEGAAAEASQQ
jgi:hypothetical protein